MLRKLKSLNTQLANKYKKQKSRFVCFYRNHKWSINTILAIGVPGFSVATYMLLKIHTIFIEPVVLLLWIANIIFYVKLRKASPYENVHGLFNRLLIISFLYCVAGPYFLFGYIAFIEAVQVSAAAFISIGAYYVYVIYGIKREAKREKERLQEYKRRMASESGQMVS